MTDTPMQELFPRIVGGDEARFFRDAWRKRPWLTSGVPSPVRSRYGIEEFVADHRAFSCDEATILIDVDASRRRRMSRPDARLSMENALAAGMSVVLQALALDRVLGAANAAEGAAGGSTHDGGDAVIPSAWRDLLLLHRTLCAYLLPGLPAELQQGGPVAALDVFCTTAATSVGGHYDTGDVFYFVLEGEKEWTVEETPDLDLGARLAAEGTNATCDRAPQRAHVTLTVRPGDCLYVPPFTYHRVRSRGRSLAASFGLPTFNEVALLSLALHRLQREHHLYEPLPSYPRHHEARFRGARDAVARRVDDLLRRLSNASSTSSTG